ncbi:uncharacterized protein LOC141551322 [Sminthopsis crassicaudata]|uniref:uncharacterized protein LOC141551322 n=1 Tax=Sminthopsis crassicaudata TaxID=9301 RepID=UPI003D680306
MAGAEPPPLPPTRTPSRRHMAPFPHVPVGSSPHQPGGPPPFPPSPQGRELQRLRRNRPFYRRRLPLRRRRREAGVEETGSGGRRRLRGFPPDAAAALGQSSAAIAAASAPPPPPAAAASLLAGLGAPARARAPALPDLRPAPLSQAGGYLRRRRGPAAEAGSDASVSEKSRGTAAAVAAVYFRGPSLRHTRICTRPHTRRCARPLRLAHAANQHPDSGGPISAVRRERRLPPPPTPSSTSARPSPLSFPPSPLPPPLPLQPPVPRSISSHFRSGCGVAVCGDPASPRGSAVPCGPPSLPGGRSFLARAREGAQAPRSPAWFGGRCGAGLRRRCAHHRLGHRLRPRPELPAHRWARARPARVTVRLYERASPHPPPPRNGPSRRVPPAAAGLSPGGVHEAWLSEQTRGMRPSRLF